MENMRKHENLKKRNLAPDTVASGHGDTEAATKKKKKKKRKKELEEIETITVEVLKKKKSKSKDKILESHENVENFEPSEIEDIKSKKRRKEKCVSDEITDSSYVILDIRNQRSLRKIG